MQAFERLENEWKRFCGVENTVACASGTAALHLAQESLGMPTGSEIIMCDFSMVACPRSTVMSDMKPVFVDCKNDLLIDVDLVERCINKNTKAVMAVHIYGRRCDMESLAKLADKHNLFLIEDSAEAHGVSPHARTDATCWSYYMNKIICGSEGGMVAFKNPDHAAVARELRSLGFTAAHDFNHRPRGHNYRMSNLHAEPILKSITFYGIEENSRRILEKWYNELCPKEWQMPTRDAAWVYDIRVPGMTAETQTLMVTALNSRGIQARMAFKPMSRQKEFSLCPWYMKDYGIIMGGRDDGPESKADVASREVIYLPLGPSVTKGQVEESFRIIKTFV